ncbi:O-antigen ligase family protein [Pelagibius litoralis]|uniref:O-antigen ligase family protein n=1 Tax=Pelagibius litoralis TaxID=374515 RepID=A0A967C3D1_9PROT|nr:O-antigen ligase family protein [Pelagibius litoralis]NIA69038.1 O-antigen ligase family protein [Pelagibius litoralis]
MTALLEPLIGKRSRLDRFGQVLSAFALLLPLLGLLAPKAVVPLVLVTTVIGGLLLGAKALPWRVMDRGVTLATGGLILWCLVASSWAPHSASAAVLALRVGLLLLALIYLGGLAKLLEEPQRRGPRIGIALGFGLSLAIILAEFTFGFPIFTLLQGPAVSDYADYSRLNRGITAAAVLVWPVTLLAWQGRKRLLASGLPPAALIVTLLSQSSAAALALIAGLPTAILASIGRGAGRLILAVAIAGALIASPGIAKLMKQAQLDQADYLPSTARYRVHIWDFVADRIFERPIAGWGFDSSALVPAGNSEPFRAGRKVVPSHPHNAPLQIILELGAIGSLFTLSLLFVLGRRIDDMPTPARACATAMVITVLAIASTAYGIWQSHWLAMIGGAAVVLIVVGRHPDHNRKTAA